VNDRGALSSMLWSSFAMSNVPSNAWLEPEALQRSYLLRGGLLFYDTTANDAKTGLASFKMPNPFAPKQGGADSVSPVAVLKSAGDELRHAFLLCDAASVESYVAEIEALDSCAPTTIIAPANGASLVTTKGWVQKTLQDHEGILTAGVRLAPGYAIDEEGEGALLPSDDASSAGGASLPREDLAEVAIQCALRLSHTAAEGAPPLRVVRVTSSDAPMASRPLKNYDSVIAGPKFRARQGTVKSADWTQQLAPFGVIKASDPDDWRLLIDVDVPVPGSESAVEVAPAAAEVTLTIEVTKEKADDTFGISMSGGAEVGGVVVTKLINRLPFEQAGALVGDTIASIGDQPVASIEEVVTRLKEAPVGAIEVQLIRGRETAAWVASGADRTAWNGNMPEQIGPADN